MTECGAGPRRWTEMLSQWRLDKQSLMVVDQVAEKSNSPAMFIVIAMEEYSSLGKSQGYARG
eukprot:5491880-Lingulodinium_polyedra.AAC.1